MVIDQRPTTRSESPTESVMITAIGVSGTIGFCVWAGDNTSPWMLALAVAAIPMSWFAGKSHPQLVRSGATTLASAGVLSILTQSFVIVGVALGIIGMSLFATSGAVRAVSALRSGMPWFAGAGDKKGISIYLLISEGMIFAVTCWLLVEALR